MPATLTPPTTVVDAYERDGFVRMSGLLDPALLLDLAATLRRLVRDRTRDLPPLAARGTYGRAFQQVTNLWRVDDAVRAFVHDPTLARVAAELMQADGARLYHDQALFKEPGGGPTPWHADQHYWPLAGTGAITAWIPLQDTSMELGPLAFAAGSHRLDLGRHLAISDDSERHIADRVRLSDLPVDETPYRLGDVSFHAGWTFHRAGGNRSAITREVMTIIWFADGTCLAEPANPSQASDWATWMPGATIGEPVATPLNPLLWSHQ